MKKFIKEYLKVFSYTTIGLIFIFSSFYLVINFYHYQELNKEIYLSKEDMNYIKHRDTIDEIKKNLINFKNKKSTNNNLVNMYNKLSACISLMQDDDTLYQFKTNSYLKYQDVYKLGAKFQNDVFNRCYVLNLSYLEDNPPTEFEQIAPFIETSANLINNQIEFALDEIKNNGSYFYTTNITSITVRNALISDYHIITNSYNEFANIILELTNLINELATTGGENA